MGPEGVCKINFSDTEEPGSKKFTNPWHEGRTSSCDKDKNNGRSWICYMIKQLNIMVLYL